MKHAIILTNEAATRARLEKEERGLQTQLFQLESRLRQFQDQDQPAYEKWLRSEFGQTLSAIQETGEKIRLSQSILARVQHGIDTKGYSPREALHAALYIKSDDGAEQEARKRAKLESKRELRREAKKAKRKEELHHAQRKKDGAPSFSDPRNQDPRRKVLTLYRHLARLLHPDSFRSKATSSLRNHQLWIEVQNAYEASDLHRLFSILAWVESGQAGPNVSPLQVKEVSLSMTLEKIRTLRKTCQQVESKLQASQGEPAWNFQAKNTHSERKKLKQRVGQALESQLAHVLEALQECEAVIHSIGHPRAPHSKSENRKGRR